MGERVQISFEMDKEDILKMFDGIKEPFIPKAFDDFLKTSFSSYIGIHVQNIRNTMNSSGYSIEEEKVEQIVIKYLKGCIEEEDMEALKIEAAKAFFKESFANRVTPNIAIYNAFKTTEVIAIAETIQKKLIGKYYLASV